MPVQHKHTRYVILSEQLCKVSIPAIHIAVLLTKNVVMHRIYLHASKAKARYGFTHLLCVY